MFGISLKNRLDIFKDSALYLSVRLAAKTPSETLENVLCKPGVLEENSPKNHIFMFLCSGLDFTRVRG